MVKVEQIYTACVSEAAYFIVSDDECCVIDPLRELKPYTQRAETAGAHLKYIFETHFHADFVSGHCDLAKLTGAKIVFGPLAAPEFPCHVATDGEVFKIGRSTLTAIHTPGHTMESTSYLLKDEEGKIAGIFTGDTLFIDDVGRPDLAQKAAGLTTEQLAAHLYNSLRNKIMPLPDETIVYPAHGAGSACGKALSEETYDTLGHQKKVNYALRADMTIEEFTKALLDGLAAPPAYFPRAVAKNKTVCASYDSILHQGRHRISAKKLHELLAGPNPPLVIDTRRASDFHRAHIRGTVFTGIDDGKFAPWIATAIGDIEQPYVIIPPNDDHGKVEEGITRLSRFGFDNPMGHLHGGFQAWLDAGYPVDTMECIEVPELHAKITEAKEKGTTIPYIVDVRNPGEYAAVHVGGALNIRLNAPNFNDVDISQPAIYGYCVSGYRSTIFLSLLRRIYGYDKVHPVNIVGGMTAIRGYEPFSANLELAACQKKACTKQA